LLNRFCRILKTEFGVLKQADIDRLKPAEWANDEIVNYGMG